MTCTLKTSLSFVLLAKNINLHTFFLFEKYEDLVTDSFLCELNENLGLVIAVVINW